MIRMDCSQLDEMETNMQMNDETWSEKSSVKDVRGDGALSALIGGYDEKLNRLSDQIRTDVQALSELSKSSQTALTEMKTEILERQQQTSDSLSSQVASLKRAVDDLSRVRYFERENPFMLEVIQSLCAMPRDAAKYSSDEKLLPRLLRLLEDLEVSLERTGLCLNSDYAGHGARFVKMFDAALSEPRVLKPCVLRGEVAVLKGTAVVPEGDKNVSESSKPVREFAVMDIESLA